MPQFEYIVLDSEGRKKLGIAEAADRASIIDSLQRQGNIAVQANPLAAGQRPWIRGFDRFKAARARLTAAEVAEFTRELSTMLSAGQDLDRGLKFLAETAPHKRVRGIIEDLKERLRSGSPLSTALEAHKESFSQLYVGLIKAGEAGGSLTLSLTELANMLEAERKLRSAVLTAMIYPALLLYVAVAIITLLLTVVLPQFIPLFVQNGLALPAATQFFIGASAFIGAFWPYLLILLSVLVLVIAHGRQHPGLRLWLDGFLLKIPLLGPLRRENLAARFTRTLGTLLANGLPLVPALSICQDAIGDDCAAVAIATAAEDAKTGTSFARSVAAAKIFPERTIHLLLLGEETGDLAGVSLRAAQIHDEKTRLYIQRFIALLVPAVTLLMGVIVASIVASLLMAMLSLNDLAI